MVNSEVKVSMVEVESSVDNMATLPVRSHGDDKSNANKGMELKYVQPKPNKRTSLFIIMSFVYAKLLVVVCVAYVISDAVTHNVPLYYYEGFFTYLYGVSILFLLYVFCFLLQESACCGDRQGEKPNKKAKEKEKEKERKKEEKEKKKEEKERLKKEKKEKEKKEKEKKNKKQDKQDDTEQPISLQWQFESQEQQQQQQAPAPTAPAQSPVAAAPQQVAPAATQNNSVDVEAGTNVKCAKRKTTQNDQSHGSFFLRIGAIAFGLGTMIYNGLEFGVFFEVPFTSPCYMILRGVNPVLQMVFTFMQMYFIFMNSRLNIHRFKVIARFGLMHVVATNICVWIRTLVLEYLKEITNYHLRMFNTTLPIDVSPLAESIRQHNLRNANTVLGTHKAVPDLIKSTASSIASTAPTTVQVFLQKTASTTMNTLNRFAMTTPTTPTIPPYLSTTLKYNPTTWRRFQTFPTTTTTSTLAPSTTTLRTTAAKVWRAFTTMMSTPSTTPPSTLPPRSFFDLGGFDSYGANNLANVNEEIQLSQEITNVINDSTNDTELIDSIIPQALKAFNATTNSSDSCGRVNIMGSIVQDAGPYLYPFIIEYSLIGAAVIYVMWKHIGKNPRYVTQEDLEHRLEVMLSRRAVALAHAQQGRVDCVGASKGLFFGLLLLVGSLICLILFFVLVHHRDFGILAIYLADVSHCVLMVLSIVAIIVGFIRVQSLKFKTEEQSDLNDILLRVSAFGLFLYAVFSVIAGHLNAFTREPNLLVMITGVLAVVQVVLQLLFIADVSRRRVHLPEHDRSKPGRQVVTFLLICNVTMWIIYTFEMQKVEANPVQLEFYGYLAWSLVQRFTLPLCIFHRFHSAVTLAEIWKTSYKARLE